MADPERLYKPNMVITTPRLLLRDMDTSESSCAGMFRIRSDPRMASLVNHKAPAEASDMQDWVKERLKRPNTFGFIIELREPEDPSVLGTGRNVIGSAGANRTPEFGYSIDPDHWGKGYATEAMRAILDAYWDTWPAGMASIPKAHRNEAWLRTSHDNFASIAVAKKLGFEAAGEEALHTAGGALDGKMLLKFVLKRPEGGADRPRAYEKIEQIGPNTCEGEPIGE